MEYAIKQLENAEEILKDMIDGYADIEVEGQSLKEKLEEVQTAILVLNASQELINIGKAQILKNCK